MLRIVSFSLLIILQVVTAEPPPPHCRVPHSGVVSILPHLFKEEDFKECGIELPSEDDASARRGSPDCSKQMCLLKIHNLMKDDDIDKDAAIEYVDKWAEANPDYKEMAKKAKEKCLKPYLPGPPQICEPTKIMFCIKSIMFMECPKWEDTDNCKKVKEHIEECKVYF